MAIKPSGVAYKQMQPEDMVVLDLNGRVVEGSLRPSSDAPTHLHLYRFWPAIGGIAHAHSDFCHLFCPGWSRDSSFGDNPG